MAGIEYRAFRNTDPPQLAEIWRAHSNHRGWMQPMSAAVLERFVFSRPSFDRQGLIVAVDEAKVLGYAHAGFGWSVDGSTLSTDQGVTCLVLMRPEAPASVAAELVARSEIYLRQCGAAMLFGGGNYPMAPFYFGLYGGSEPSGILDSDPRMQAVFEDAGYQVVKRSLVLHRDLAQFRPVVDRQQLQIRRQSRVECIVDPPTKTWAEAAAFEPLERTQFMLLSRAGTAAATVDFWSMETMIGAWGVHAVGIVGLEVLQADRRQGLATHLLGEALRQLHAQQGVSLAEVHVPEDNAPALALFRRLGFEQVDRSVVYRKD